MQIIYNFLSYLKNKKNQFFANNIDKDGENYINDNVCIICSHDIDKNKIILKNDYKTDCRCNYSYHKQCIEKWFEYNMVCPLCKSDVNNFGENIILSTNRKKIFIYLLIFIFYLILHYYFPIRYGGDDFYYYVDYV